MGLAEEAIGLTPVVVGFSVSKVEQDRLVEILDRRPEAFHVDVGQAPSVVGLGAPGGQPDGLVILLNGPRCLLESPEDARSVVVRIGVIGVEPQRLGIVLYGLLQRAAKLDVRPAPIVVGLVQ